MSASLNAIHLTSTVKKQHTTTTLRSSSGSRSSTCDERTAKTHWAEYGKPSTNTIVKRSTKPGAVVNIIFRRAELIRESAQPFQCQSERKQRAQQTFKSLGLMIKIVQAKQHVSVEQFTTLTSAYHLVTCIKSNRMQLL